ncbi:MAG: TonB-dependent receptor, partial [Bacteroidia bacterium]|nr:TonB-dependent receptor [Bacteroidia bacterium]
MNKFVFSCTVFSWFCVSAFSQNSPSVSPDRFTVSGYVKEDATGETMIGANAYIKELMKGTVTNTYGFYSLTVPQGNYTLVISYLGFTEQQIPIVLEKDLRVNINLKSGFLETKEVVIEGDKPDRNVKSTEMGRTTLEVEKIKSLPAFMGEVDVLKTIQLLPGVLSAGEGNTGYYVRGGGPDQNLILLDEAVVYNASHLFGFFSVFNSDAIKNVTLFKGGMPAQYGGRLSSVLDISMKEGNMKEYHAEGGLGFIASRLTVQGP